MGGMGGKGAMGYKGGTMQMQGPASMGGMDAGPASMGGMDAMGGKGGMM